MSACAPTGLPASPPEGVSDKLPRRRAPCHLPARPAARRSLPGRGPVRLRPADSPRRAVVAETAATLVTVAAANFSKTGQSARPANRPRMIRLNSI